MDHNAVLKLQNQAISGIGIALSEVAKQAQRDGHDPHDVLAAFVGCLSSELVRLAQLTELDEEVFVRQCRWAYRKMRSIANEANS